MEKKLRRREFMKNATAVTAGAMAATVGSSSHGEAAAVVSDVPDKWDYEVDVVVVGYGGAGASAAISASDKGAKVLVLEKAPFGGGNTGVCTGVIVIYPDFDEAVRYYSALTQGTVPDEELIRTFVRALQGLPDRLQRLGLGIEVGTTTAFTAAIAAGRKQVFATFPGSSGEAMFEFLDGQVANRKVQILYETPAKSLIREPESGEVIGIKADSKGKSITVKANRGVIMTCGGYENNPEIKANYNFPGVATFPAGTPYNQGDGIRMVSEIGAPLWHLTGLEIDGFCHKRPSEKYGVAFDTVTALQGGYIWVNRFGRRFMPEGLRIAHRKSGIAALEMDYEKGEYQNLPAFMIFDEACRIKGPVWAGRGVPGGRVATYAVVHNLYEWSKDNSAEIESGWILKADTIPDLAAKAGIDSAGLQETIRRYNKFCAAKKDEDFDLNPNRLIPLGTPPFYCSELAISVYSTTAGPVHNSKCEVLDWDGSPVPRLFAAGEFGSMFGYLYQAGNGFAEAMAFGFIAGEQAAERKPRA